MYKFVLFALLLPSAFAQKKPITLETLNQAGRSGGGGRGFFGATWAPHGKSFVTRAGRNLVVYDGATQKTRDLVATEAIDNAAVRSRDDEEGPVDWTNRRARLGGMQFSADGKSLLYTSGGDIFVIDFATGKWDQLTKTAAPELDAKLSPDGKTVAFRRGWDLYAVDVASKKETRLTMGGTELLRNGALDWVYPEELDLPTAFWWSPDSKSIAYLQFDLSQEPVVPHEDVLKVRAMYEPERYPQAGENNANVHIGVVAAAGGRTRWYDAGDTRDSYLIARAGWMPNSRSLYVLRFNRVQNHDELFSIDLESGAHTTIFQESDPYWINLKGDIQFLADGKRFLWTSERDGWRHIYLYSNDGKQVKQLTTGAWEVTAIDGVDEAAGRVWYTSTEPSSLEHHLYSVSFAGADKRALTPAAGTHNISMAPNGAFYLDTFSSLTSPARSVLHSGDGKELAVYREADRSQADEYDIRPTEIVSFKGADGTQLYGRLIKPAGYQQGRKYPVVVTVYGGPGVGLPVHNSWQGVNIDQVLAHKGYIIWQCENRGGMGRGHAFETAIYHRLGTTELADQVAGIKYLIDQGLADPARIGIHGWSYGGTMTLQAMLNAPDVFRAGFSGAPVVNSLFYDTIYTERYMGLPSENPDGYKSTDLTLKAGNLKGRLMLVHNFEDDNVLFQNSLQMTNALQLAGKQFDYMLYPQKSHGVSGPASRQMNQMMIDFFDRNLK
jgi:dipeptidyl-peptidase-4